jgi:hypothetical protein
MLIKAEESGLLGRILEQKIGADFFDKDTGSPLEKERLLRQS